MGIDLSLGDADDMQSNLLSTTDNPLLSHTE